MPRSQANASQPSRSNLARWLVLAFALQYAVSEAATGELWGLGETARSDEAAPAPGAARSVLGVPRPEPPGGRP